MNDKNLDQLLAQMFQQAQAQFGNAVKSHWFNDSEICPGCGKEVDALKFRGKDALSLNAFIYRERGVLIGYLLCGHCAGKIMKDAKRNPYKETVLHSTIEKNLTKAYKQYIRTLDA
jgi:hypothetical protein